VLLISFIIFTITTPTNCTPGSSSNVLELDAEALSSSDQCHQNPVCLATCSQIVPGCTAFFYAAVQTTNLVPAHYFQHSCMYKWGLNANTSELFNHVAHEYDLLVKNHGYPKLVYTDLQNFEENTYSVCAGQLKCAGFGLSALLSAYIGFDQQCQQHWMQETMTQLQKELNQLRGTTKTSGYGGADFWIKSKDSNPAATYKLLLAARIRLDKEFISRVHRNVYDYCSCTSYNIFNSFITDNVIPKLVATNGVVGTNTWLGSSTQSVYIASGYLAQWQAWNPGFTQQLAGIKTKCKQLCRHQAVATLEEEEDLE